MVQTELLQPQEIEVHYVLPMIRKQLALAMKENKMSQKEIAQRLHLRESTVSQYITDKRGSQVSCDDELKERIRDSATRINSKSDVIRETQLLLRFVRHSKRLCEIHKQLAHVPDSCTMEVVGCDKE